MPDIPTIKPESLPPTPAPTPPAANWWKLTTIILTIILVGESVYLAKSEKSNISNNIPSISIQPSSSIVQSTAKPSMPPSEFTIRENQKIYKNNEFGFSFEIPANYFIYDHGEYAANITVTDHDLSKKGEDGNFQMTIWISKGTSMDSSIKSWQEELGGFEPIEFTISGVKAKKGFVYSKWEKVPAVWTELSDELFMFTLTTPSDSNEKQFDQILSSIEFY